MDGEGGVVLRSEACMGGQSVLTDVGKIAVGEVKVLLLSMRCCC